MPEKLDDILEQMREIGDRLVPLNYPLKEARNEADLNLLKLRDADVDGYPVTIHYSRSDFGKYYMETFQIMSRNGAFLPFSLALKMARKVLGNKYLSLVEIFREGKKIYCWTVHLDKSGKPVVLSDKRLGEDCVFEGFHYKYVYPSEVDFY